MEPHFLSATEILQKIRNHETSCEEVMSNLLKRISLVQEICNPFEQLLDVDTALKKAQLADKALKKDPKTVGKLHGLPITIKDAYFVEGFITSCGCQGLYDLRKNTKAQDATAVSRLKKEGAIVIGMTNVPELLICPEADNLVYGQTKNPYDLSRSCGGSSGGEAAAIAACASYLGLGSDGGGSIRVPAHYCGIAGMKPTHRIIPDTGNGLGDDGGLLNYVVTAGPMARRVDDLMLALPILIGPDGVDAHTIPFTLPSVATTRLESLRVAFFTDDGCRTPQRAVAEAVHNTAHLLKPFIKSLSEDRPDGLEMALPLLWDAVFLRGDRGVGHKQFLQSLSIKNISPLFAQFLERAERCNLSVTELHERLRRMDLFRKIIGRFFEQYDILLTPVIATIAKKHGEGIREIEDLSYTMFHNITGYPAAVVRCAETEEGVPIGIQIIGRKWEDHRVLAVAKKIEELTLGWQPSRIFEI